MGSVASRGFRDDIAGRGTRALFRADCLAATLSARGFSRASVSDAREAEIGEAPGDRVVRALPQVLPRRASSKLLRWVFLIDWQAVRTGHPARGERLGGVALRQLQINFKRRQKQCPILAVRTGEREREGGTSRVMSCDNYFSTAMQNEYRQAILPHRRNCRDVSRLA